MTRPAAVLFDCDGVVVDSEGPSFALFLEELALHGLPLTMEEFETHYVGGTVETVAARARAAGARLPDGWVAHFYGRMYAMLAAGVPLVAGVTGVLDRLDAAGVPYAMGSNGSLEKMQITLGQHGLLSRFRAVLVGAGDRQAEARAGCLSDGGKGLRGGPGGLRGDRGQRHWSARGSGGGDAGAGLCRAWAGDTDGAPADGAGGAACFTGW